MLLNYFYSYLSLFILLTTSFCCYAEPYVQLGVVKDIAWPVTVPSIGTVKAVAGIQVSATVSGIVDKINFNSGDSVKKGQLLFELQHDDLSAIVRQDNLNYLLAKQQFNRYLFLYKKKVLANAEIEKYKTDLGVAKAKLDYDNAILMKTLVKAPFSGLLGIKNIHLGQYVRAGQQLVDLEDRSILYVDFYLSEKYSNSVKAGDLVQFTADQIKLYTWSGKIVACDSHLDADTRSRLIRAVVTSSAKNLIPAMYVHVSVYLNSAASMHRVVPQSSVVYSPNGFFIFTYKNGKVKRQAVKLGEYHQQWVEVITGLEVNQQIVTVGQDKLFDGATVNVGGL